MKNHVQIYIPKCPRTYEKHLLNLLKSSRYFHKHIDHIETLEKLCQTMKWHLLKTQLRISQFLKIEEYFLSFSTLSLLFPCIFLILNVAFIPGKKPSALCKFKFAMKQPTLASFFFLKISPMIRINRHRVHGEKILTNVCRRPLTLVGPQNTVMFHFNETTD